MASRSASSPMMPVPVHGAFDAPLSCILFSDVLALGGDQVFQCCGPVVVVCDSRRERCRRWLEGGRVRRVPVPARTRRWIAPLSAFGEDQARGVSMLSLPDEIAQGVHALPPRRGLVDRKRGRYM